MTLALSEALILSRDLLFKLVCRNIEVRVTILTREIFNKRMYT